MIRLGSKVLLPLVVLVGALSAMGCTVPSRDPVEVEETPPSGKPIVIGGQDRLSADGFPSREQRIKVGTGQPGMPSGEKKKGPLPDPWTTQREQDGPLPDPWRNEGSDDNSDNSDSKP